MKRVVLLVACASCMGASAADPAEAPPANPSAARVLDERGCAPPTSPVPVATPCLQAVRVRVLDDQAAPAADLSVTVCGDVCLYGTTDANGVASVRVQRYMINAAVGLHGKGRYTSYYVRIDGEGALDLGTLVVHRWTEPGVALPDEVAGGDVTTGPLSLRVRAGSKVFVDLALSEPDEKLLRARVVPVAEAPAFVRAVPGVVLAVALAPFGTLIDPRATLGVRNDANLPPGTAVDLFVHTTDPLEADGPWAGFPRVAPGHVTSDGAWIRSDDAAGIPELSWIAVRRATSGA